MRIMWLSEEPFVHFVLIPRAADGNLFQGELFFRIQIQPSWLLGQQHFVTGLPSGVDVMEHTQITDVTAKGIGRHDPGIVDREVGK